MNTRLFSSLWYALLGSAVLYAGCNILRDPGAEPPGSGEAALRRDIAAYAQKYKGSRYTPAGKHPSSGFDCSGFTGYVMQQFKIRLPASSQEQARHGHTKRLDEAKPGDLVFFRRSPSEPVFHVAMVLYKDRNSIQIIHSTTSRGVVVDDLLQSSYWRPKIYTVKDVVSVSR